MARIPGLRIGSVLFFASGATGLAYEVIWFRRFAHIWGASSLAMAAVVASFLLGLGIGAHFMGRRADRARVPLRGYAWCEAGIGLLALLIPYECGLLAPISAALYPALHDLPVLHTGVRLLLTFLVIGPPCILMGGTFPLLVRQFTPPSGELGSAAGWIYAVNTGGAAIGCYLAGFHLLPWLGLSGTNTLAAGTNLAVAAGAFALARTLPETSPAAAPPPPAGTAGPALSMRTLYGVAAITGLAALLLQMVWTRQLCVMLGGSTYALTATLFVILLGIGLGSLIFRASVSRLQEPAHAAGWALGALILSAGAARILIPELSMGVGVSGPLRSLPLGNAAVCVAASAVLEFIPSVSMGFLFPLLVHLTRRSAQDAGRAVGSVYAWNTAGSIVGAAATAPLGLALLGGALTQAAGLTLYYVSALLLVPLRTRRDKLVLAGVSVLSLGGIVLGARNLDPRETDQGMYLYGYRDAQAKTLIYFKEGASCNVLVAEGLVDRSLSVNGKVDATSRGDMDMQLGIACLPRFLRPLAKNVLVIGFGSGTTSGASLLFPGTRVTCCEIERAVFKASEHFADVNYSPEKRPGFTIVFDDGRSHLQGTRESYDIILSEPSNPWLAGVSSLFTREFYETCRAKLGERGLLGQWIQLYSFSEAEYALVVRTVTSVFPHACLIRVSSSDSILLASQAPILPSRADIDAAQALVDSLPEVRAGLERHLDGTDVRSLLLTRLLLDEAGLKRLAAGDKAVTINTDLNLRLEFDAPLRLFHSDLNPDEEVDPSILQAVEIAWIRRMVEGWGCTKAQVKALQSLVKTLPGHKHSTSNELLDLAVGLDPDDPALLAQWVIAHKGVDEEAVRKAVARILERSPLEAVRVATEMGNVSKVALAVEILEGIVAAYPGSATAWEQLAINCEKLKDFEKAGQAYRKAFALDPLSSSTRRNLEEFEKKRAANKK